MPDGFTILYEEGPCLVVSKPSGVLTQAVPGVDSLEVRVKAFLRARDGGDSIYLGVPHRLDRPASGALLLAKDLATTRKIGAQFENRRVKKTYWACVSGRVTPERGRWEDHVFKVPGEPRAEIVAVDHAGGRFAALEYRVLTQADWGALLEIELQTGRTHQIRIQAGSRGYPVLGDKQYGSTVPFGPQFDDERLQAIGLHARSIAFRHPISREIVSVEAPVAEYWPAT